MGGGHLRASHADREQVIGVLKAAFVQGRLTKDELEARAGQTFAARTYGELAALTADLPAGLTAGRPVRAQARPPMRNTAKAGLCVAIAVAVAALLALATDGAALFLITPFYFMGLAIAVAEILATRLDKRSGRGPGPRPTQRGQVPEGEQRGKPGKDWARCQARPGPGARFAAM